MKKVFYLIVLSNMLFFTNTWSQEATLDIRIESKLQKIIDIKISVTRNSSKLHYLK